MCLHMRFKIYIKCKEHIANLLLIIMITKVNNSLKILIKKSATQ